MIRLRTNAARAALSLACVAIAATLALVAPAHSQEVGEIINFGHVDVSRTRGIVPPPPFGCTDRDDASNMNALVQSEGPYVGEQAVDWINKKSDDGLRICTRFTTDSDLNWRVVKVEREQISWLRPYWYCITAAVSFDIRPPGKRLSCFWVKIPLKIYPSLNMR